MPQPKNGETKFYRHCTVVRYGTLWVRTNQSLIVVSQVDIINDEMQLVEKMVLYYIKVRY